MALTTSVLVRVLRFLKAWSELWPSYNWYYETDEQRYYNGTEPWNEWRF